MVDSNLEVGMKKLVLTITLALLSGCCGVPKEALDQASIISTAYDSFVGFMEQGHTTREQEQDFIRANRKAWHTQNLALNDIPLPEDLR